MEKNYSETTTASDDSTMDTEALLMEIVVGDDYELRFLDQLLHDAFSCEKQNKRTIC